MGRRASQIGVVAVLAWCAALQATPTTQDDRRLPLPSGVEQQSALRKVAEAFEPSNVSAIWRDRALKTRDDPVGRYVMLIRARELSISLQEPESALDVCGDLARDFQVDGLALAVDSLADVSQRHPSGERSARTVVCALAVLDELVRIDRLDLTDSIFKVVESNAVRSGSGRLLEYCRSRIAETREFMVRQKQVAAAESELAGKRDDPALNLTVGRYKCFVNEDWSDGLAMLAKCSDQALRRIATMERSRPRTAARQVELGNAWCDFAATASGREKVQALARCELWYQACQNRLEGLNAALVQRRLQQIFAEVVDDDRIFALYHQDVEGVVIFVCDASGSMLNKFPALNLQLRTAIELLDATQSFNIICMSDPERKPQSLGPAPLSATADTKRNAYKFLDGISTSGATDPIAALELAFKQKPLVVYLLSDGDFPDHTAVLQKIQALNKDKLVKINTILFIDWSNADKKIVDQMTGLASDNGGTCKLIDLFAP